MNALDRFVKRYRRRSSLKALGVWGAVFSVEERQIATSLLDGRL